MRTKLTCHFFDPATNKRLIVKDATRYGNQRYLSRIWMIPSKMTNIELVTYFARKLASKAK